MHRRLVSTAAARVAHVAPSTLPAFPPKAALTGPDDAIRKKIFDPDTWAALQAPPHTALHAFAHRAGLASVLNSSSLILQACTHPSFAELWKQHFPTKASPHTNAQLARLGNSLMGLFATEYLHAKYPHLPTRVLMAAVTAYVGPATCTSIVHELGAVPLLRWHRTPETDTKPALLQSEALASIPRALTGLVYQQRSMLSARQFVHSLFLSRQIDLRGMIKFEEPKRALYQLTRKLGRETPRSRLLKETGRYSNSPMYVVGVFSGADKLGEGYGSSLRMAEFRAAEDALLRVYLTEVPDDQLRLPSDTFPAGLGDVFALGSGAVEQPHTPLPLGLPEILFDSSKR